MKDLLNYLFEGNRLSREKAKEVLISVGKGAHSEIEFASLLTVYRMRPISPAELAGFREAMLDLCLSTDLSAYNTIDIVGTGGDGKNTFNISTLASFIVAGAGYKVAKHGNYAVSSTSGSSNVLEYLGYKFSNDKFKLENELEKAGITFLHAPLFHPAMKYIAPVRKALKVKTFFNILGPMTNPSFPKYQVLGVYNNEVFELYKEVYKTSRMAFHIINSLDGYDEISLTGKTHFASNLSEGEFSPSDFGFSKITPNELFGGNNIEEAAKIFTDILSGKGTNAQNNVVIANAALGIKTIEPKKTLRECVEIATESLNNGKALQSLKNFIL
ncbi:MAG: anthranilate phosphoribosyltransferase [Prolixibacteraceae bacterium]|nr:anthranilate phosphoribosyltransferase [Prolixibacteraceae bacterium]MBN2775651.1 anthranilate phosphoribosyltransferase [Prolixibacteraceae bacterium]